jgi:hypothetical protein
MRVEKLLMHLGTFSKAAHFLQKQKGMHLAIRDKNPRFVPEDADP